MFIIDAALRRSGWLSKRLERLADYNEVKAILSKIGTNIVSNFHSEYWQKYTKYDMGNFFLITRELVEIHFK